MVWCGLVNRAFLDNFFNMGIMEWIMDNLKKKKSTECDRFGVPWAMVFGVEIWLEMWRSF